jgi:hypothetical protein
MLKPPPPCKYVLFYLINFSYGELPHSILVKKELRKKGMAWIPKGSIWTQDTGDDQGKGATHLKEKKRYERRSSKLRFAPNHQNFWSLPSPFALHMPIF